MLGQDCFEGENPDEAPSDTYERDGFTLDSGQFELGPDTYNQSDSRGERFFLVEDLPRSICKESGVYALCSYDWNSDRQDKFEWIGYFAGSDPAFTRESLNAVFKENDVPTVSEGQFNLISAAYEERVETLFRNCMLEKGFQFYGGTFYMEVPPVEETDSEYGFPKQLIEGIESQHKTYEQCKTQIEEDEDRVYRNLEEAEEVVSERDPLDVEHIEALDLLPEATEYPHDGDIPHVHHATYVAELSFERLAPPLLRAIELVHQSVLYTHRDTALALALFEWGWSQKRIADELGKSQSTVSQQLSKAKTLLKRAKWTTENANFS